MGMKLGEGDMADKSFPIHLLSFSLTRFALCEKRCRPIVGTASIPTLPRLLVSQIGDARRNQGNCH